MTTQSSQPGRRLKVTVSGKDYLVDISGNPGISPLTVHVDGQPYVVHVETAASAAKPVQAPATPSVAAPPPPVVTAKPPAAAPVRPPAAGAGPAAAAPHVKAPMPGNIIEISVSPGAQVARGQTVMTLEAMKMKNAIRAPRDGVVATIEVTPGQTVAHGQVLFTFATDTP